MTELHDVAEETEDIMANYDWNYKEYFNKELLEKMSEAGVRTQVLHTGLGFTPLLLAKKKPTHDVLVAILKETEETLEKYNNINELHREVGCVSLARVEILIKKGVDINSPIIKGSRSKLFGEDIFFGLTPLHRAAWCNAKDCINLLLKNGADINSLNYTEEEQYFRNGITPLRLAEIEGHTDTAALLKQHGAE